MLKEKQYCLATTAISEIWDLDKELLVLGPWCLVGSKNKELLDSARYQIIPSPWKPKYKIKQAADYCRQVYDEVLPILSKQLNLLHQVSYPVKYWRILIGPWLLHFIGIFYDRYKRIESAVELFPNLYTYVIPRKQCRLTHYDTLDFFERVLQEPIKSDYYNLKLFSIIFHNLYPNNLLGKELEVNFIHSASKLSWKRKIFNCLKYGLLKIYSKSPIVLTDMCHLPLFDMFLLKLKIGVSKIRFINFKQRAEGSSLLNNRYSCAIRKNLNIKKQGIDQFKILLYKLLPEAIPICYVEDYKHFRHKTSDTDSVKVVGTSVGWFFNEEFKFFAAQATLKGVKIAEFQHGGGYGMYQAVPSESLSLEKDMFYTWGRESSARNSVKTLPDPYLSQLKNSYSSKLDNILFIGTNMSIYVYRLHSCLQPEDMSKYFEDKNRFFNNIEGKIKEKILYRPYFSDYGWQEKDRIKKALPNVNFLEKGKLYKWIQKAKIVVIDHPHTSFLEALVINAPSVFYWDHDVYLMREQAEPYFEILRRAGIVHKTPEQAAMKVNEIYNNPKQWWLSPSVQNARQEFCNQFAYTRKDWLKVWAQEFNQYTK